MHQSIFIVLTFFVTLFSSHLSSLLAAPATQVLDATQALDRSFYSRKLGISLQYPSTIEGACSSIPVTAHETFNGVEFYQQWGEGKDCESQIGLTFAQIYVRRVKDKTALEAFVHDVISPNCSIWQLNDFPSRERSLKRISLRPINPPQDEHDLRCAAQPLWHQQKGIVLYTRIGEKTGGAFIWNSANPIRITLPEAGEYVEKAYDNAILASLKYLDTE